MQRLPTIFLACLIVALPCLMPLFDRQEYDILTIACSVALLVTATLQVVMNCFGDKEWRLNICDILFLAFIGYSYGNSLYHDSIHSVLVYWKWSAAIAAYIIGRVSRESRRMICIAVIVSGLIQSTVIILQRFGVIDSLSYFFPVSGTFGNPAPTAALITVALSLCIATLSENDFNGRKRTVILIGVLVLFVALVFSNSRACWVATIGIILFAIYRRMPNNKVIVTCAVTLMVVLPALYFIRPGSADVRLLIWRASVGMYVQTPIFGAGATSFAQNYMYAQADYFANHPDSVFIGVATDHVQSYNEIIHLACEQGAIGLAIFLLLLFSCYKSSRAMLRFPIVAIAIFSLFLYTSDVFIVFIIWWLFLGFGGTTAESILTLKGWKRNILTIVISVIAVLFVGMIFEPNYLENNARFPEYPTYWSTCDEGMQFEREGEYGRAEESYVKAFNMVPNRITAPYRLFRLYSVTNTSKAEEIAEYILYKQKVQYYGNTVLKIRSEVRQYLNNLENPSEIQ